jgi:hypothetical protein
LKGLETEYEVVHHLVEQTVIAGEGNSLLLLGSRGCGKTTVVETVISSLSRNHRDDFHVVRLNGFLHTDDRIALREIWRQLGRETSTQEDFHKVNSYADTMASLLAVLSHPEEIFGPTEDPNTVITAKSVIIMLDEFDLFSYHPRQTLLYNLFDIAQARKAPVAVLGLTTKVDVAETLEKRVKSRFSHRYVFLPRPRSFADFSDICMAALTADETELSDSFMKSPGTTSRADLHLLTTSKGRMLLQGWAAYLQVCTVVPVLMSNLDLVLLCLVRLICKCNIITDAIYQHRVSGMIHFSKHIFNRYTTERNLPKISSPAPSSLSTPSITVPTKWQTNLLPLASRSHHQSHSPHIPFHVPIRLSLLSLLLPQHRQVTCRFLSLSFSWRLA